jgi:hypothetical protein
MRWTTGRGLYSGIARQHFKAGRLEKSLGGIVGSGVTVVTVGIVGVA